MTKIKWSIITLILIVITVSAFIINENSTNHKANSNDNLASKMNIAYQSANYYVFKDLNELEEKSELIVLAKITGNRENIIYGEFPDTNGYTLTEIEIEKVIKKPTELQLEKNDIFEISEPYFIDHTLRSRTEPTLLTYEGYTIAKNDSYYIFYLGWHKKREAYSINALYQGKYNIDGKDKLEGDHPRPDLKKAIKNKYELEINKVLGKELN